MQLNVEREVAALERMTVGQLRERFGEVFGEQTNARHKQWLIKRIAWKMQANIEGDISERARRRAAELSKDVDNRTLNLSIAPRDVSLRSRNCSNTRLRCDWHWTAIATATVMRNVD